MIVDDASTDNTAEVCREILKGIPLTIVRNDVSKFSNEIELRKQLWSEVCKSNPDWIVVLDADQMYEAEFKKYARYLISIPGINSYASRLFDLWSETCFRDDPYWKAHNYFKPFLLRYQPGMKEEWRETAQHCGSYPMSYNQFHQPQPSGGSSILAGRSLEDRIAKYYRYKRLDPEAKFGIKEQYESILDPNPHLLAWVE